MCWHWRYFDPDDPTKLILWYSCSMTKWHEQHFELTFRQFFLIFVVVERDVASGRSTISFQVTSGYDDLQVRTASLCSTTWTRSSEWRTVPCWPERQTFKNKIFTLERLMFFTTKVTPTWRILWQQKVQHGCDLLVPWEPALHVVGEKTGSFIVKAMTQKVRVFDQTAAMEMVAKIPFRSEDDQSWSRFNFHMTDEAVRRVRCPRDVEPVVLENVSPQEGCGLSLEHLWDSVVEQCNDGN